MRALLTAQPTSASASLHALLIMTPVLPGFQNLLGPLLTSHVLLPCHQVLSTTGQPGPGHGKKLGHRSVDASGETTYKKVLSCWVGNGGRSAWAGRALPGPLGGLGVLAPGQAGLGPPSAPWWTGGPSAWVGWAGPSLGPLVDAVLSRQLVWHLLDHKATHGRSARPCPR